MNFISETVLIGFKAGVALRLASTQLPKLCGIEAGHGDFLAHADQVNWPSFALGGTALLALAWFLLGAVETAAIGRMFAEKRRYRLDSNQEFLALAGANLATGIVLLVIVFFFFVAGYRLAYYSGMRPVRWPWYGAFMGNLPSLAKSDSLLEKMEGVAACRSGRSGTPGRGGILEGARHGSNHTG